MKFFLQIFCLMVLAGTSQAETLNVFAASSMKTALDQIDVGWKAKTGQEIVVTYGSTATLAKQIQQSAPADIFISADVEWMDDLASKNLIKPESRKNLTSNSLVIVAAATAILDPEIKNLAQTLGTEKIVLGDIKSVPVGKYAKAALDSLGLWQAVEPHTVMQENSRAALALVVRGEAKLGIVYGSDATAEVNVNVLATFPEPSHPKIIYPAAIIATSSNPASETYLDYLTSREARLIFKQNGFTLLQ
jgi:molybdate transport system substrate-binding protein